MTTTMHARSPTVIMTSWLLELELGLGGAIDFGKENSRLKGVGMGGEESSSSDCGQDWRGWQDRPQTLPTPLKSLSDSPREVEAVKVHWVVGLGSGGRREVRAWELQSRLERAGIGWRWGLGSSGRRETGAWERQSRPEGAAI